MLQRYLLGWVKPVLSVRRAKRTACSQTPVWEHHCRETEFLVHYIPKQEFGSEQLKVKFQKAKV
ncbi:MAG: hypothetical protein QG591_1082 [Planctomycetota bacterium]|nr:hypothetical protein [Planctomycetota bacterium]